MSASSSIAVNLACVVLLLRDRPEARDEQAAAFRALHAVLPAQSLRLGVHPDGLVVNRELVPATMPGVSELLAVLRAHGIGELEFPMRNDAVLLSLLRSLAVPAGSYHSLMDLVDALEPGTRAAITVHPPEPVVPDDLPFRELATEPPVPAPEATPPAEPAASAPAAPAPAVRPAAGVTHGTAAAAFRAPVGRPATRRAEALARLAADPASPLVSDWLNELVGATDELVQQEDWGGIVDVVQELMRLERSAAGQAAGRAYPIALRRILSRNVLAEVAGLVVSQPDSSGVREVLRRMGADATEVLLDLLAGADTIDARRLYYNTLREMTEGATLFANMLNHEEWYVVRNVADLCGDLRLEEAVPQLARRMNHPDERVRRSVATALAKIGTAATIEPMRQALRDPAPAVRLQAVRGLDGWRSRGLAMTLALLLDQETHPEIMREMMLALGRIGTPEAIQALGKAAAPGGRLFSRKPQAIRVAAIEGLRTAGPAAGPVLQNLITDDEPEVRSAAARALAHVTEQE